VLGKSAKYVWGVGLLAAGQSSTMTGTYAGTQIVRLDINRRYLERH
jgi:natural resistance-associated macrophage protein